MSEQSFLERFPQSPVSIRGVPGKAPMFFRDLSMMGAVFTAPRWRARSALPKTGYKPLVVPPGRALVAVHCMEYKDSDIGPYNEVALSIALKRGPVPLASTFQAVRALATNVFHAYVKSLPVTTEVALHGGIDFFNYPKFLADITFRETAGHRICTVRDKGTKDLIMEFEGRRISTWSCAPKEDNLLTLWTYPEIGGKVRRAKLLINQRERGACLFRGAGIRLGRHPAAGVFRELGIGLPFQYVYAPRCQGVLFAPESA